MVLNSKMLIKSIHLDPFSWSPRLFGWFWTLKRFGIWELQNWKNYSSYTVRNALHTSLRAWNAAKNYELYYWLTIIIGIIIIAIIISIELFAIYHYVLFIIYHLLCIIGILIMVVYYVLLSWFRWFII